VHTLTLERLNAGFPAFLQYRKHSKHQHDNQDITKPKSSYNQMNLNRSRDAPTLITGKQTLPE
jgi:hypothetical protein